MAQVKFYISVLESKGIKGAKGIIDYPRLRKTETVELSDNDKIKLADIREEIKSIISCESIPDVNRTI
ncbi:MAG: Dna2/Cas4 domain-containing protein [Ignavibacteria bacterium]|jgi:CRISPR-associated exonuclease Cas4